MEICTGYRGSSHSEVCFPDGNCPVCDANEQIEALQEEIYMLKDDIKELQEEITKRDEDFERQVAKLAATEK